VGKRAHGHALERDGPRWSPAEVARREQDGDAADDPRCDHRCDAEEVILDRALERDADHRRGDEGDREGDEHAPAVLVATDESGRHRLQTRVIEHDDGKDGASLDRDRVRVGRVLGRVGVADAEQLLRHEQVPGRRDRQELGESLDDSQDRRLDKLVQAPLLAPAHI